MFEPKRIEAGGVYFVLIEQNGTPCMRTNLLGTETVLSVEQARPIFDACARAFSILDARASVGKPCPDWHFVCRACGGCRDCNPHSDCPATLGGYHMAARR